MLKSIVEHHWHVPTSFVAFQKWLLQNRDLPTALHLDRWKATIKELTDLTEEERMVLKTLIQKIDDQQTEFTLEVLFALTNQVSIQYEQNRYVLFKYLNSVTYEDVWNQYYLLARGSVIDVQDMDVVTPTLPKFFNIDEKAYTSFGIVSKKAQNGTLTRYIKQDGSCVSLSYRHDLLLTTPGSFRSDQTKWAREYLTSRHQEFLQDVHHQYSHYSFIFEYVGPENQIVVVYPKTDMILLHVIDARTGKLLPYEEVKEFGDRYEFTVCDVVDLSLDVMMSERENKELYAAEDQEGWIVRVDIENETFLVKLKCADYVQMHRAISNILNPKFILECLLDETFDDKFAQIRSETIKSLVIRIKDLILAWNTAHIEKFQALFDEFPADQWGTQDVVDNFHLFEQHVATATTGIDKEDRVRKFLHSFAKGKTSDPKEEILLRAKLLMTMNFDFSRLDEYDSYKSFVNNRIQDFVKDVRQAVHEYVFNGVIHPVYAEWLSSHYSNEFHITENVDDLENWESIFQTNKEQYLRLSMTKKEKLTPQYFSIHDYCVRKRAYETKTEPLISSLKKEMFAYLLGDAQTASPIVTNYVQKDWVIDKSLRSFHVFKETFENQMVASHFPEQSHDEINRITREFYLLLRGFETDNSYEVAQSIFATFPEDVKQHQMYFKERGKFSGYVNRHIPSFYRDYFFTLFELNADERLRFIRELNFLEEANVVLHEAKTDLTEVDIDFRSLRDILSELANQDS